MKVLERDRGKSLAEIAKATVTDMSEEDLAEPTLIRTSS
jgi:hypothetical protein